MMSTRALQNKSHVQGKTTALPDAPLTRGKRKLNFSTAASSSKNSDLLFFRGKKLFLDLPGYNKIDQIEHELTQRGGTVERRFHSGVKYLITNRPRGGAKGAGSQLDSPSTPSPCTPASRASSRGLSKFSPNCVDNRNDAQLSSRAAMMFAASQGKKKSTDLRALAEKWGCKVLSLTELLKELRRLKPLPKKDEPNKKAVASTKVRKLKPPFMKVEDLSFAYRPLVYETRQWPRPDLRCSPKGCPFDPPKQGRGHHTSPKEAAATGDSPEATQPTANDERRRPGYCECCSVRYNDLSLHLKSVKHLEYANDDANFTSLDDVISKGTSLKDFLSSVRASRTKTPPSTPTRRSSPRKVSTPKNKPVVISPRSPLARACKSPAKSPARVDQSKEIILDPTGALVSPKRGMLRLTPVKESPKSRTTVTVTPTPATKVKVSANKEYTPGFSTPPRSAKKTPGGSRLDPVTRALLQNGSRVNSRLRAEKKKEPKSCLTNHVVTRSQGLGEIVPETPEKNARRKGDRPLVNIDALLDRISAKAASLLKASVKQRRVIVSDIHALIDEVAQHSSSSPSKSASITPTASPCLGGVRKSPRLVQRELLRYRPRNCDDDKWFTSLRPKSLVVSYDLSRIYPQRKRKVTPAAKRVSLTPTSDRDGQSTTPEIEFQGATSRRLRPHCSNFPFSEDSPLIGAQLGDESFRGFSPNSVAKALPDFKTSLSSGGVRKSPRKMSVDNIALRLANRMSYESDPAGVGRSRLMRKRGLDVEEDDDVIMDPSLSPPPNKKRRLSDETPPSSPTSLRPRRRKSPRLASFRKLLSSSEH